MKPFTMAPKTPPLYARIRHILESARAGLARSVKSPQVLEQVPGTEWGISCEN